jgi:hypothetical protein
VEHDSNNKDDDNNNNNNKDNNNNSNYEDNIKDNIDNKENSDNEKSMPPKFKLSAAVPAPNKKSPRKEPGVENITAAVSKKLIASKPYSMVTLDGYMVKPYCQKFTDHVEVDIHVAGELKEHSYKVESSADGLALIWRRAIPDYFFESKRMIT